jgi:anti-sigma regulatory factor (Ser/Thr protein kinase)
MRPPYLVDRLDADDSGAVSVSADIETETVLMAVQGSWSWHLCVEAGRAVKKCMSEHPVALIVDVREVTDPRGVSVNAWINARHVGQAMDPPVEVLICAPPGAAITDRLRRLGASRFLPVFATVSQARAAAGRQPAADRLRLSLSPDVEAPGLARNLVTDACAAWHQSSLLHRGRSVVSELVTNAAQHARTPVTVLASRRAAGLHLMVGDGDRRLPRLRTPRATRVSVVPGTMHEERGLGLRVVDAAASLWGAMPTTDGKIVWAAIYPRTGHA